MVTGSERYETKERLALDLDFSTSSVMGSPTQPVTLSVEQIDELNHRLSRLRHDVNNNLSLIIAAAEMVRFKPDFVGRMMDTLTQQTPKITDAIAQFSQEFEKAFGITRP